MQESYVVLIEESAYGPFTEDEVGAFRINYEASFEFFLKPALEIIKLVKLAGGDAAELHMPPMDRS